MKGPDSNNSVKSKGSLARSYARKQKGSRVLRLVFFCIFGAVGAGALYPLGIRPILKTIKA